MIDISDITGTGVALVTPFNEDFSIDYTSLGKLIKHVTDGGVDYITVLGTTAESVTVSKQEKSEILDFVRKNNTKKLPIVYGVGGNNTAEVIKELQETDLTGVCAILSVAPYYNKPSQEGLFLHYTAVADASPLPIILYNVPGRTGLNMTAKTVIRLSSHKNIIGIKEASGDLNQCMEIMKGRLDKNFVLLAGDDLLAVPMASLGAIGSIAVLANLYPKEFSNMIRASVKHDFKTANEELYKFIDLNPLLYTEGNPVGAKAALAQLGLIKNIVRLPLAPASAELQAEIKKSLF